MFTCTVAYTRQVIFFKCTRKTRQCLTGHRLDANKDDKVFLKFRFELLCKSCRLWKILIFAKYYLSFVTGVSMGYGKGAKYHIF